MASERDGGDIEQEIAKFQTVTSGGVVALTRSRLATVPDDEKAEGDDGCLIPVKLKGMCLDIYAAYMTGSIGWSGLNITTGTEIAAFILEHT